MLYTNPFLFAGAAWFQAPHSYYKYTIHSHIYAMVNCEIRKYITDKYKKTQAHYACVFVQNHYMIQTVFCQCLLLHLFKMLIVLDTVPVAAPRKAMLYKKLAAKIILVDFIRKIRTAVRVGHCIFR